MPARGIGIGYTQGGPSDAWTAYTPTLGGTGWALGAGTLVGAYYQVGKLVHFRVVCTFGAGATFGASASPTFTMPVTAATQGLAPALSCGATDTGTASYRLDARFVSSSALVVYVAGTNGLHALCTATVPHSWASTDILQIAGTYEAA